MADGALYKFLKQYFQTRFQYWPTSKLPRLHIRWEIALDVFLIKNNKDLGGFPSPPAHFRHVLPLNFQPTI